MNSESKSNVLATSFLHQNNSMFLQAEQFSETLFRGNIINDCKFKQTRFVALEGPVYKA
jgi:hypothetical protein